MQIKGDIELGLWEGKHYAFFQNKQCECFPCHPTNNTEDFNCLFCFCPLYPYTNCGGVYTFTEDGIKDCSACLLPHMRANYPLIIKRLRELWNQKEAE